VRAGRARARGLLGCLGLAALAGCSNEVVVRPVIDRPPGDSVFGDLDVIELSVAIEGQTDPLKTSISSRGEPLELIDVPYGQNLVIHMLGRVNNSEVAYGRTCKFAVRAGEEPPAPYLYFSRTVQWAASALPPNKVRIGGAALTSRNGSALYFGGRDEHGGNVLGADRFDPSTGKFEQLAMLAPRLGGSAASLGDGRALLVGGVDQEDQVTTHIDMISIDLDPEEAVEVIQAEQLGSLTAPALATLSDGSVVALGGRDANGKTIALGTEIAGEGGGITIRQLTRAKLAYPRYGHTLTRLSDDLGAPVLIAGGRDESGAPVPTAELYRPLVEQVAPLNEFAKMIQVPRWDHTAVRLPDGSVLIVGGRNANGPVPSVEVFTLEAGFIVQGLLPLGSGITDFSVTPLPDGRVLIAGGRDAAGRAVDAALIVRIDSFGGGIDLVNTDRLSLPRAGHQATLLCDGTVLLVGGTTVPMSAERYNPPSAGRR
jgi:hypothetical protein